jgi:hypothetical protein
LALRLGQPVSEVLLWDNATIATAEEFYAQAREAQ